MVKTALVADNDVLFVEFLSELLAVRGYRVFKASDGPDALVHLEQIAMDIFFVDIFMPKMDGREAIRKARELLSSDDMKIIAVSGAARETIEGLDGLDFDAYIQKAAFEDMSKELDVILAALGQP